MGIIIPKGFLGGALVGLPLKEALPWFWWIKVASSRLVPDHLGASHLAGKQRIILKVTICLPTGLGQSDWGQTAH